MLSMRLAVLALFLIACSGEVVAQATLTSRLLDEYVNPTNPVAADDATSGASVSSTRSTVEDPMQPFIWFRTAFNGTLSVTIKAADGRYKSRHEITASVPQPGWYSVRLSTGRPERLAKIKSYKTHQLAFEVRRAGDRRWMLVAWGPPPERAVVTLYVSAPSGAGAYLIDPLSGRPHNCEALTGVEATEFDHACSLELKSLQAATEKGQAIKVFRPGFGGGQSDDAVFAF